ncbi:MAG TPA: hypothetical protein VFK76_09900 [Gaiellaceae bacterium]|nr:hypothetical protein [Gaiellaceae bacterium]
MSAQTGVETGLWETIAGDAAAESALWAESLLPPDRRALEPVFSALCPSEQALGVETIYEGYLVHYGRSRLFAPRDDAVGLLLGDYLYAHGLVHVAGSGDVAAVVDLAELISLCAQVRTDGRRGDAEAWAATAALLGTETLDGAREALRLGGDAGLLERAARSAAGDVAVDSALAAHARFLG